MSPSFERFSFANTSRALFAATLAFAPVSWAAPPAKPPTLTYEFLEAHVFAPDAASIIVAHLGDEPITLQDLGAVLMKAHVAPGHDARAAKIDYGPLIERVIDARLIAGEARNMGMDATPEFLKAVEDFKASALQETLKQSVTGAITPDPAEVERLYKDAIREWKVKSVLVTREEDAKKLTADLKAGKPFDALVKQLVAEKKARGGDDAQFLPRPKLFAPVEAALQRLKLNELSPPVQVPGGWAIVKYEDVRYPEDPKAKAAAESQSAGRQKKDAMVKYYAAVVKRYVKADEKLLNSLNFEAKEPGFAALLKDTRVLAQIEGGEPLTVGDLAAALQQSFFHGVDRASAEKKLNREKLVVFDALISQRVVPLEVAREKIAERPEFKQQVDDYITGALFSKFMETVIVPGLKLDEPAARKYYDQHRKDYTFPAFYTLESLAFTSVKEAQAALTKLQARTDFKWLNANADGQVKPEDRKIEISGTLSASGIPADLAALLANAKKGDFRLYPGPESQFFVIHVLQVTPAELQPFEEARAAVNDKLFGDQLGKSVKIWATKLRKARAVKIYVKKVGR